MGGTALRVRVSRVFPRGGKTHKNSSSQVFTSAHARAISFANVALDPCCRRCVGCVRRSRGGQGDVPARLWRAAHGHVLWVLHDPRREAHPLPLLRVAEGAVDGPAHYLVERWARLLLSGGCVTAGPCAPRCDRASARGVHSRPRSSLFISLALSPARPPSPPPPLPLTQARSRSLAHSGRRRAA